MGPNDAEMVRVWTRDPAVPTIADVTLPVATNFEVVVECEAGTALHGSGAQFSTNIVIRDITANNNIAANPAAGFSGAMATAAWQNYAKQFVYTLPAANLAGRQNHVCQVLAYLQVGVVNPDVSFASSPLLIITS